ncbi:UDP-N-acetylglucosamine 4,6-dehydratase (inverting) [Candidiatus Paracoxiella cheracis]|uniref:UDP-N-acetylglucosamine 4,6-dehydratase (inverting) n=1 Tax=Candidiatus Paracoxiella cheracis TaxID=3405120 RepID=UPI003BF4C0A0
MGLLKNFLTWNPDLTGKSLLITGGTGSFGQCFVKKVIENYKPKKLIIFSRDELKQYEMSQVFSDREYPFIRYFIGDVRDYNRLEMALRDVDIVIHAAALKHVPIAEYNPYECIQTNVIGAQNIVRAALMNKVETVLALSTDKAVNPINLYGASKLAAEKIFIAGNNIRGTDPTRFSVVRYGNVIGSRGSVVKLFKKLLANGAKSLPITDERMTRFWITLPQSVDFVLSCLTQSHGGEIFVPKIPSMRIVDLAKAIAPSIGLETIGIRPGEKLHEWLLTADEAAQSVEMSDRYVIKPYIYSEAYTHLQDYPMVADGFTYSSVKNTEWLTSSQMQELLHEKTTKEHTLQPAVTES